MPAVIAMLVIWLAWALVAGRLARWNITAAMAMIAVGIALTAGSDPLVHVDLDNRIAERIVEVTLAFVLFVDATEVPWRSSATGAFLPACGRSSTSSPGSTTA
jgi:sodium/hydrogen antiporter